MEQTHEFAELPLPNLVDVKKQHYVDEFLRIKKETNHLLAVLNKTSSPMLELLNNLTNLVIHFEERFSVMFELVTHAGNYIHFGQGVYEKATFEKKRAQDTLSIFDMAVIHSIHEIDCIIVYLQPTSDLYRSKTHKINNQITHKVNISLTLLKKTRANKRSKHNKRRKLSSADK